MTGPNLFGVDLFGDPVRPEASSVVGRRFVFPPFSVLSQRSGSWQERKRAWLGLGIRSEVGREEGLTMAMPLKSYETAEEYETADGANWTSVFDPVLCELVYRWWSAEGDLVLDPFAGGSVRGIVAGSLGRAYHGIELRREQVLANREQANEIETFPRPRWVEGDSTAMAWESPLADLVFSCPPYGDLEVYSDDPRDLSSLPWETFALRYREIIEASVGRLRRDRFAAFVVGNFRDARTGFYRDLVGLTVRAFEEAGAYFYNDAVLVGMVGSGSMRANRQFGASRKLVKGHQNLLVFAKGDPRAASDRLPDGLDE